MESLLMVVSMLFGAAVMASGMYLGWSARDRAGVAKGEKRVLSTPVSRRRGAAKSSSPDPSWDIVLDEDQPVERRDYDSFEAAIGL
jgi:hypothetical protein